METGKEILDLICETAGIDSFESLDLLDYGSGYRMAQVLLEYRLPFGSYCGIDLDPEMIDWLQQNNPDPRMSFALVPFANSMYRPQGEAMTSESVLPINGDQFDVIMMLSVVTHLAPDHTRSLLTILRRHLRPDGFLFFSCFTNPVMDEDYAEGDPEHPLWMAVYNERFLFDLLDATGWRAEHYAEPRGHLIQHHLLCRPTDEAHPPRPDRVPGEPVYLPAPASEG